MEQEVVKKKKNKVVKIISIVAFILLVAICGVIIFFNVSHEYYLVVGPSMTPTLNNGIGDINGSKDGVFVSKIKGYTRGDIIVLNRNYGTGQEEKDVIKRVIAIEGDKIKVALINNEYRIVMIYAGETNFVVLEEDYLLNYDGNEVLFNNFNNMIQTMGYIKDPFGFIQIQEDSIFCLGDNRTNSIDSATYGAVSEQAVIGKVDYIIYDNKNIVGQVIGQVFGW